MKIRFSRAIGAAVVAAGSAPFALAVAPAASAEPCPDVEVVFARGTSEGPGLGGVGQAFVDAVRAQVGQRTVSEYAVNYPASNDFSGGIDFALTVIDGIRDESSHVEAVAANCPDTRIILGGFSQGAAVTGFTTVSEVPAGIPADLVPEPMPAEVADHVAAVVLFGKPSAEFITPYGAPPVDVGPLYVGKTLELCASGDTICDGSSGGGPTAAHGSYPFNGQVTEGAAFAVGRI